MNESFIAYFRENFFQDENELKSFLSSLTKNLTKTIRINTNKISVGELKKMMENEGYILDKTFSPNVFFTKRGDDYSGLEKRLGFSLEHLIGYFYIQELGASSSVFFLSDGKIDINPYLILDMASSPGGKTTQLAEYYPNSFIVANEFDRNRTAQLISNIERMGLKNYGITNYNGQFLARLTETFDKVLLDAPCSGEGIGFKNSEALKNRHIKNVKKIADVQFKLIEGGLNALKIGGELLYSTCTMNKLENEEIIEKLNEKYPESFEVIFEKRFWPHIDETGGFFVCKIKKIKSINFQFKYKKELANEKIKNLNSNDEKYLKKFFVEVGINFDNYRFFKYENEILVLDKNIPFEVKDRIYLFKFGQKIGKIESEEFLPNYYIGRDFGVLNITKFELKNEIELDKYLRGEEFIFENNNKIKYVQIFYKNTPIGLGVVSADNKIKNSFPAGWRRR